VKWIDAYYLKAQDIMAWQAPQSCSWILKRILNCREIVTQTQYWDEAIQNLYHVQRSARRKGTGRVEKNVFQQLC
jgi:hypothetical protein